MSTIDSLELGTARQNAHPNGTPRYYSNPNEEDTIGVAGELAFANKYGLKMDEAIRPNGDGHIDFKMQLILDDAIKQITIDIKTAKKAYNLLIKDWEMEESSDILVLGRFNENETVDLLGWEYKSVMAKQPKKIFSSLGIVNHYKPVEKLRPMHELDVIMKRLIQIDFE